MICTPREIDSGKEEAVPYGDGLVSYVFFVSNAEFFPYGVTFKPRAS